LALQLTTKHFPIIVSQQPKKEGDFGEASNSKLALKKHSLFVVMD